MKPLTKMEVHQLMSFLTKEQQAFLLKTIKQSKKSKWLEVLAQKKGICIKKDMSEDEMESMIDDWVLVEILDSGFGNRDYQCECGKPLRYQYVVLNKTQGKTYGLGETCFQNHTNLSADVVKDILNGFHKIDLERDEILIKVDSKRLFDIKPFLYVEGVPSEYIAQADIGLPLTDKQIAHLEGLKKRYNTKQRAEKLLQAFKPEARDFLQTLPERVQNEVMTKVTNDSYFRVLPDDFHDEEIERFLSLGLPLLDKQMERIFAYNRTQSRDKALDWKKWEEEIFQSAKGNDTYLAPSEFRHEAETITFETLVDRHLTTLRKVREKEDMLSRGMKNDWERVQQMVRELKNGKEFDYSSFKVNLEMICLSLKI